ncbi:MAG: radical SAM protein [candidate division WOR-3 bacterium]|nr:MAG: radical SAM protein [candidate division WOR-3 bacterium]
MKFIKEKIINDLYDLLSPCRLCPRGCGVDRLQGEVGDCGAGLEVRISSYHQHFGEEPPLVGIHGSGTIFFAYCNVHCVFCQNYDISQHGLGREVSTDDLAHIMMHLQDRGCHNINLVTPTPWVPQIVKALARAQDAGLSIPVVYNCGGYESVEVLKLLDGIIDIYMPDMKYGDDEHAEKYSGTPRYWDAVTAALREMHRQVGELTVKEGIALRGVLVRHLVLPHTIASSDRCFEFIARELSRQTVVNVMAQYYPTYRATEYTELNRRITVAEFNDAVRALQRYGLDTAARVLEHHK